MFKFLILLSTLISFQAQAVVCATSDRIKNMDPYEAIDLAYKSGPAAGNFAFEWQFDGLVYMSKENAMGNMDILEKYPEFNQKLVDAHGDKHYDSKNTYNGIFQITYDQVRQCRRQVLITGVEYNSDIKENVFTGWVNVEYCDPGLKQLFAMAAAQFEAQGQKLDNVLKLLAFVDGAYQQGAIDENRYQNIKSNLDPANAIESLQWQQSNPNPNPKPYKENGDYGVYFVKNDDGHIVPRFSLRIDKLQFTQEGPDGCGMSIDPTIGYSGVLKPEVHSFSNAVQSQAKSEVIRQQAEVEKGEYVVHVWDPVKETYIETTDVDKWFSVTENSYQGPNFYLSYVNEDGEMKFRPAVVNASVNNEPYFRLIDSPSDYLNIRTETNSSGGESTVCGIFNNGDVVEVVGYDVETGWLQVKVDDKVKKRDGSANTCGQAPGGVVWITGKEKFSRAYTPFRKIIAKVDLNVRYEPDSTGDAMVCGTYKKDEIVRVLSVDPKTGWFQVEIKDDMTKTDGTTPDTCDLANDTDNDGKFWMSESYKYSEVPGFN